MRTVEKILVADDDADMRRMFRRMLETDGYEVIEASDGVRTLEMVEKEEPSLVYLDVFMPKVDGLEVIERLREKEIDVPVIVITGVSSMETAIRAVRNGAYEYLTKPIDLQKIMVLTKRCLDERRLKSELVRLREKLPHPEDRYELIGKSAVMLDIYKAIGSIAATPNITNVLILGDSGTGKELVAQQIHRWGSRPEKPFLPLNITALPDNLLESELFGYERGAFTGAVKRKPGKLELVEDGTIFLDEIGDLSLSLQQKLLRVIQEREFVRLGGHETIPVRARFIAATHGDLESKVAEGKFRQDLFFRLNVVTLHLPPLRDRKDDIPQLAQHFAEKYAKRMQKELRTIPQETIRKLMRYDWPGNVRELENTIARAIVMIHGNQVLPGDITFPDFGESSRDDTEPAIPLFHHTLKEARRQILDLFEKKFIVERLEESGGNVTHAAQRAEINRKSFQRLMRKHGIRSRDYR